MSSTDTTITPALEPAAECAHVWKATSFDWTTMRIAYRCACGSTKDERARPAQAREWRRKL